MSMIKDAIEKILSLAPVQTFKFHDHQYADKQLVRIEVPTFSLTKAPKVSTLSAIADYIVSDPDKIRLNLKHMLPIMVHIESPTEVSIHTSVFGEKLVRTEIMASSPTLPMIAFGKPLGHEEFVIMMQSKFVRNVTVGEMLKLVSSIRKVDEQQINDNGISQTATAKSGVTVVEKVNIPNPVVLKPYRTFVEVDQPESDFVFRLDAHGQPSLHEADGGAWKIQAMENIKGYFERALSSFIEEGAVIILC